MKGSGRLCFAIALFAACLEARADTIYLKNGNELEGVVTSENASTVVVDIGYGTVNLQKTDILKIRRSPKKDGAAASREMRRREFESGRRVPVKAKRLNELFQAVQLRREKAFDAKAQRERLEDSAQAAQSQIAELKTRYAAASEELQRVDVNEDPLGYNSSVAALNKISARIRADEIRVQEARKNEREADSEIRGYLDSYRGLEDYLQGQEGKGLKGAQGWEADYYAWIEGEIGKMRGDFRHDTVKSENQGEHIIVTAVLNGSVPARLMVDTGASMTTINQEIADSLHLGPETAMGTAKVSFADGRILEAKVVRLDSVAVGKSAVKGASAMIVPSSAQDLDGLLGMSFLNHFIVKVDGANGRLFLEELK